MSPEAYAVYASKEEDGYPISGSPFYAVDPTNSSAVTMSSATVTVYEQETAADVVIF